MKNAIVDYRASQETVDALLKMDLNIIKTPKISEVSGEIDGHADIMLHQLNETTLIVYERVFEYFKEKLPEYNIIKGNAKLSLKYPYDIAYNAAKIWKNIICNKKYTERGLLEYYHKNNYNIINVKQGYSKCSICVVSDNALITSDTGIHKAALLNKIDSLLVNDNCVKLEGFEHGFFGGATGLLNKNKLLVNGDIELHSDSTKIKNFCRKYGVEIISLNNKNIYDVGTIIIL